MWALPRIPRTGSIPGLPKGMHPIRPDAYRVEFDVEPGTSPGRFLGDSDVCRRAGVRFPRLGTGETDPPSSPPPHGSGHNGITPQVCVIGARGVGDTTRSCGQRHGQDCNDSRRSAHLSDADPRLQRHMQGSREGRHQREDDERLACARGDGLGEDQCSDLVHGETKQGCQPTQEDMSLHRHSHSCRAVLTERGRNMEKIEVLQIQVKEAKDSLQGMQRRILDLKKQQQKIVELDSSTLQEESHEDGRLWNERTATQMPSLEELERTQELVEGASATLMDGVQVLCSNETRQQGLFTSSQDNPSIDQDHEARETKVQLLMRELSLEIQLGQIKTKVAFSELMMKQQETQVKALVSFLSDVQNQGKLVSCSLSEEKAPASKGPYSPREERITGQISVWIDTVHKIESSFAACNSAVTQRLGFFSPKVIELLGDATDLWSTSKDSIRSSMDLCAKLPTLLCERENANSQLEAARKRVSQLEPLRSTFQASLHILSTNRNKLLRQVEQFDSKLKELGNEAQSWQRRIEDGSKNSASLDKQMACLSQGIEKAYKHERALSSALLQAHKQHARVSSEYKGLRTHLGKVEAQHRQFEEHLSKLKKRRDAIESSNRSLKKALELKAHQNEAASVRQEQCVRNLLTQNQTTEALLSKLKDCKELRAQSEVVLQQREAEIQGARKRIGSLHEQVAHAEVEASLLLDGIDQYVSPYIALSAARTRVADLERRFEDSTDPMRSRLPSTSLLSTLTSDKENLALVIEDVQERIREKDMRLSCVVNKHRQAERDIEQIEQQIIRVRHGDGLDDAKKINILQHKVRSTSQYVMALTGERGMWLAKINSLQAELDRMERCYGKSEEARLRWSADAKTMDRIRQLPSLQEVKDWAPLPIGNVPEETNSDDKGPCLNPNETMLDV